MGKTKTNLTKAKRNLNFYFKQRQIFFKNDWCRINGSLCEPSQSCNICTSNLRSDGNWSFFTAWFFVYEVTSTKFTRDPKKELLIKFVASVFMGLGSHFLILWVGIYV